MATRTFRNTCVLLTTLVLIEIVSSHDDNMESLYPGYKLIKDTIESNPKLVYKLKQTFNSPVNHRYWQIDGVEVIPIDVNVSFLVQNSMCSMTGKEQQSSSLVYWEFQWTNSLLLNLIWGDLLLAMDPSITAFLYSSIVRSHFNRQAKLSLHLNTSALPCNYTLDELKQAIALFLCTVSIRFNSYLSHAFQSLYIIIIYRANQQYYKTRDIKAMYLSGTHTTILMHTSAS